MDVSRAGFRRVAMLFGPAAVACVVLLLLVAPSAIEQWRTAGWLAAVVVAAVAVTTASVGSSQNVRDGNKVTESDEDQLLLPVMLLAGPVAGTALFLVGSLLGLVARFQRDLVARQGDDQGWSPYALRLQVNFVVASAAAWAAAGLATLMLGTRVPLLTALSGSSDALVAVTVSLVVLLATHVLRDLVVWVALWRLTGEHPGMTAGMMAPRGLHADLRRVAVSSLLAAAVMVAPDVAWVLFTLATVFAVQRSTTFAASQRAANLRRILDRAVQWQADAADPSPLDGLLADLGELLRSPAVHLSTVAPDEAIGQVGTAVESRHSGRPRWLIAEPRKFGGLYNEDELRLLEAGAAIAGSHVAARQEREILVAQSQRDPLTGTLNRKGLEHVWVEAVQQDPRSLAVMYLDLNQFKPVNDAHGHHVGDEVLRTVAGRLRDGLRAGDLVVRLGGDEFVCLLPGANEARARDAGQRMIGRLTEPYATSAGVLDGLGAAVGVLVGPFDGMELDEALERADRLMYLAKSGEHPHLRVDVVVDERIGGASL